MTIKGSLPEGRFTPQELLDFAYDSLLSEFVPVVLETREEYFVYPQDFPINQGQASYFVPSRAMNGVLREVKLVKADGSIVDLTRIDLEDVTSSQAGTPNSFYMSGNSVILHPTPLVTQDTLRLYYFIRPSRLVTTAECAVITAIDRNASTATISIPTGWTTANTFDLVRGRAHFDILALDLTSSSVAGGSITLSSIPDALVVGDYVTLAEETCFPALPPEGHVALVQSAVTAALESIGDPNAGSSAQKTQVLKQSFQSILKTRIQGAPKSLGTSLL